eukprot:TRINITY_DN3797_c0_g1_i2.p1 TRINITY_DN3797_c0_g1~~TRINITY_DN3797_c0_g1_i2.p1  ORF type:complete len:141 (-),score=22.21 TRINITY_DN3797_c0_g1_i2:249-671(-)
MGSQSSKGATGIDTSGVSAKQKFGEKLQALMDAHSSPSEIPSTVKLSQCVHQCLDHFLHVRQPQALSCPHNCMQEYANELSTDSVPPAVLPAATRLGGVNSCVASYFEFNQGWLQGQIKKRFSEKDTKESEEANFASTTL